MEKSKHCNIVGGVLWKKANTVTLLGGVLWEKSKHCNIVGGGLWKKANTVTLLGGSYGKKQTL